MKRCDHSYWLGLGNHGNDTVLLESDRLRDLTKYIHHPDVQKPSLFVLIGNVAKSVALRELFGVKRRWKFRSKRNSNEVHLHLDPSTIFTGRPIFLADIDLSSRNVIAKSITRAKCHEITRHTIQWTPSSRGTSLSGAAASIYARLLFPFADTFCFFSTDLGGFRQIAVYIAAWLDNANSSTLPKSIYPRILIVSDKIPLGPISESEARRAFLWMLSEETTKDPFEHLSAINVVALLPNGAVSDEARYRPLKERLMDASNQVRINRETTRYLFSVTHFRTLFNYACIETAETIKKPFNFISASRMYNPTAPDLEEHISTFLKYIRMPTELTEFAVPMIASSILLDSYPPGAHMFDPVKVFELLYRDTLHRVSKFRVMAFEGCDDVILRSGFIKLVERRLLEYFMLFSQSRANSSAEIHRQNLDYFRGWWRNVRSDSTCFTCLRRRPQYKQHCGHSVCQTCVVNFGDQNKDDPWEFHIRQCFLCKTTMPEEVVVKVHPPTTGAGILCIDGGGVRGIIPLMLMKRIQDRIGLPIPIQNFIKVAFGVSSGGLIILDTFLKGCSIEEAAQRFERLAKLTFQPWKVLDIPPISRFCKTPLVSRLLKIPIFSRFLESSLSRAERLFVSYFADGLYPAQNIEVALKEAFGTNRSILDHSHATSLGTRIGLPVATVQEQPSCRVFTNYNGVGARGREQDIVIKPEDGFGNIPVWKIARSISAAPGFFPPKTIHQVGTFQDAGPLENDPLLSALSETTVMFPLIEEPDFVISLATGEPKKADRYLNRTYHACKDKALPRLCRLLWEKMRDKNVRRFFLVNPRYHRLDVEFEQEIPRLDDTESMSELKSKVQDDQTISDAIDRISLCLVASLFYFELESIPERINGKSVGRGHIQCSIRRHHPGFSLLLDRLSSCSAVFYLDDDPIPGKVGDGSFLGADGNFRKQVELNVRDRVTISLRQGNSEPYNISGSPFTIERLILAQGLDAHLGTANHRKRKSSESYTLREEKRRRIRMP